MTEWDGKERRKMSDDWIERDRMLTEVHNDVKYITKWCQEHEVEDNNRFKEISKEIEIGKKIFYGGAGIIVALDFVMKFIK